MSGSRRRIAMMVAAVCVANAALFGGLGWFFGPSLSVLFSGDRVQHTYYIPSQSMLPTLQLNDRVMPLQVPATGLQRGDVVIFRNNAEVRVARVVASAGDTVALRGGAVVLNGAPASLKPDGAGPILDGLATSGGERTRRLIERLPGDTHAHIILDIGPGDFDEVAPVRVAANHVFVMGDNRDRAADSRVPIEFGGVGQVAVGDVIGLVDTVYWAGNRARIGRPIDSPAGNVAP